jgi:hypothetical protein
MEHAVSENTKGYLLCVLSPKDKTMMQDVDDAGLQAIFIGFTVFGGSKNNRR